MGAPKAEAAIRLSGQFTYTSAVLSFLYGTLLQSEGIAIASNLKFHVHAQALNLPGGLAKAACAIKVIACTSIEGC